MNTSYVAIFLPLDISTKAVELCWFIMVEFKVAMSFDPTWNRLDDIHETHRLGSYGLARRHSMAVLQDDKFFHITNSLLTIVYLPTQQPPSDSLSNESVVVR